MTVMLLVGLVLLAVGAIRLAVAVRRSGALPAWAGLFAVGLSAWCPIFPRPARILDAVFIGVSGVALAYSLWHATEQHIARMREALVIATRRPLG